MGAAFGWISPERSLPPVLSLVLSFPRRRHSILAASSPRRASASSPSSRAASSPSSPASFPPGALPLQRRNAVAVVMADGATTAALLLSHGRGRR